MIKAIAAIQEFAKVLGYWYGNYKCPACSWMTNDGQGWYNVGQKPTPTCRECTESMRFVEAEWIPKVYE